MKKYLIVLLVFALLLCCSGCLSYSEGKWSPFAQPGSCWKSEDGTIIIQDERSTNGGFFLYLTRDQELLRFAYVEGYGNADVCSEDAFSTYIGDDNTYESWRCSYKSKKKFVATVKKTTYFEVGQKITFHRVYPK